LSHDNLSWLFLLGAESNRGYFKWGKGQCLMKPKSFLEKWKIVFEL
jgi:hypothetical protein